MRLKTIDTTSKENGKMTALKTEMGIKFIVIAYIMNSVYLIATYTEKWFFRSDQNFFLVIMGLLCLLPFGVLIFQIVGLVKIYQGRREFNKEHTQKVKTGMILIIVGLCVSSLSFLGLIDEIFFWLGTIGSTIYGLGFVFLIIKIVQAKHRTLLGAGFGASICASMITFSIIIIDNVSLERIGFLGGVAAVIGSIMTLIAYIGTYKGIKDGMIQPGFLPTMTPPPKYGGLQPDQFSPMYPSGDHLASYTSPSVTKIKENAQENVEEKKRQAHEWERIRQEEERRIREEEDRIRREEAEMIKVDAKRDYGDYDNEDDYENEKDEEYHDSERFIDDKYEKTTHIDSEDEFQNTYEEPEKDLGHNIDKTDEEDIEARIIRMYSDEKMKPKDISIALENVSVREVRNILYKQKKL